MEDPVAQRARRQAFTALSSLFSTLSSDCILEIEILPDAITPPAGQLLLRDGHCIGVPKKILRLAFLEACILLHEHATSTVVQTDQDLEIISRIALLYDPEHLTACNHLKRLLAAQAREHHEDSASVSYVSGAARKELRFVESILTSPLHRQSKSPTLWYHRLYIVQQYILAELGINVVGREPSRLGNFVLDEVRIVFRAAERHPNNYYAWQYLRRLFEHIHGGLITGKEEYDPGLLSIHQAVTQRITNWCLEHPSDTSGWMFLLTMLRHPSCSQADRQEITVRVFMFTESMSWRKEAIWSFLRSVLAEFSDRDSQDLRQLEAQVNDYWSRRPRLAIQQAIYTRGKPA